MSQTGFYTAVQDYLKTGIQTIETVIEHPVFCGFLDKVVENTKLFLKEPKGHNKLFKGILRDEPFNSEVTKEYAAQAFLDYISSNKIENKKNVGVKVSRKMGHIASEMIIKDKYGDAIENYVNEALETVNLETRERDILELRRSGLTLEKIGDEYGLTKDRIRQIEAKAFRKIHNYNRYRPEIFFKYFLNFVFNIDISSVEPKERSLDYKEAREYYWLEAFNNQFETTVKPCLEVLVSESDRTNPESMRPLLYEVLDSQVLTKDLSREEKIMLELVYRKNLSSFEVRDLLFLGHSVGVMKVFDNAVMKLFTFENMMHFYNYKVSNSSGEERSRYRKAYLSAFEKFKEQSFAVAESIFNLQDSKTDINGLDLSVRALTCLKNLDVKHLGDIARLSESDLKRARNLGEATRLEIKRMLEQYGLSLREEGECERD